MPLCCNDNNRSNFVGFTAVLRLFTVNAWTTPALCPQCTIVQLLCALGGEMLSGTSAVGI